MAIDTDPRLQSAVIYSVYVRAHTPEGTFRALIPDLPRIRALGTDILWLMPIHPIGMAGRKGTMGCPYANRDYRTVNPEYGTLEDFKALADAVHDAGMKLMIDVVYNHTSPDAVLWQTHPEFYCRRADGTPYNRVGDWSDVIDLNYGEPGLWDYQIQSLRYWATMVDGFRCDVASLVPEGFWRRARAEVAEVRPDCVWLAETVHRSFQDVCLRLRVSAMRDVDAFSAFDMEYDYDIREAFDSVLDGKAPLSRWIDLLNFQEFSYPKNYNKMRCLENHDQPRIASRVAPGRPLENYTAMLYFLKGATLLYAGQESSCTHQPSLFEKEPVDWRAGADLTALLRRLGEIKKSCLSPQDAFCAAADDEHAVTVMLRDDGAVRKVGVFSLRGEAAEVSVPVADGEYRDLIRDRRLTVRGGRLCCQGDPVIFAEA